MLLNDTSLTLIRPGLEIRAQVTSCFWSCLIEPVYEKKKASLIFNVSAETSPFTLNVFF